MTPLEETNFASADAASILEALGNVSVDAIVVAGLDGTIRAWSRGAESMYGYAAEEAVGRQLSLIIPPDFGGEMRESLACLYRGEAVLHHETVRRTKSGANLDVATRMASVLHRERGVIAAVIIDRDVTEQRWVARTLDATLSGWQVALSEAQGAEERIRRFVVDAAHQLRSPVASIQVCTEALLRGVDLDERDRLLNDLVRQTARAGRLVSSLLRIARLDQGEELVRQPCDLLHLCQEEADRVWHLAPHLDIVLRAPQLTDHTPKLDGAVVGEILANLLENAIRYADSEVRIEISWVDGAVEVCVSDDGPGVPFGMEKQVFERFFTLGPKGGSGLGLPIARELARAHGGDLAYDGKSFVARFPLDEAVT